VLTKANRITAADDYRGVVRRGVRFVGANTVLYVRKNPEGGQPRFGFIVAKTVGNAVTRNLVRRRLKAICYSSLASSAPGSDIVIRALPPSATAPWPDLDAEVRRSLRKSGTLQNTGSPV
jgi:ribonuclease P protein component